MASLPEKETVQFDQRGHTVYDLVLAAESAAVTDAATNFKDDDNVISRSLRDFRDAERIALEMKTPTNERDAQKHSLIRDGYHFVLPGFYDFAACLHLPVLAARAKREVEEGIRLTHTQVAYIFPAAKKATK
ncbi:hypothetical protein DXG03_004540 [Asterophora parasitica]|uniref:Uncharacterized protein n=1 Tax=Asterophora parasitica TaxID=117018 RepID=A0A9P7G2A5_9AGAR|nr:hypothetical protein DXG03_004540 [Asterophora parasitica]